MEKLLIILLISSSSIGFFNMGNQSDKRISNDTESKLIGSWSAMELISEGNKGYLRFVKRKKIKKKYSGINYQFKENKLVLWQMTSAMCGDSELKKPRKVKPQNGTAEWKISKDSILEIKYKNESETYHLEKYKLKEINEYELLLEILEI
ncbi:hypothetical protein [Winogradskyella sediminis]|uniref:hypothetical protein n=1 Tax=Winogradskyella sediminis TaxID=1382466 RepID=UPI000E389D6F|nr:hypothetical protein [Winogradskyella sediminis]REG82470.1 hypothetical protein C8N41_1201 [Winogradskyella sediminis]